jgi:general secretion pathway protein I
MTNDRGFTLLEVLVALAIAAITFGVLLSTELNGIRTVHSAGAYEAAMDLARSHLAMLGPNMANVAPEQYGQDGQYAWHIRVRPEVVAHAGAAPTPLFPHNNELRATLYAVGITVSWRSDGREQDLYLNTQRLGFVALPPPQQRASQ